MIKPENYGKITEIYRKNPLKSLKICRRAKLGVWGEGGSGFAGQEGVCQFFR